MLVCLADKHVRDDRLIARAQTAINKINLCSQFCNKFPHYVRYTQGFIIKKKEKIIYNLPRSCSIIYKRNNIIMTINFRIESFCSTYWVNDIIYLKYIYVMERYYLYAIISSFWKVNLHSLLIAMYALPRRTFRQMCTPYKHESDLPFG